MPVKRAEESVRKTSTSVRSIYGDILAHDPARSKGVVYSELHFGNSLCRIQKRRTLVLRYP